MPDAIARSIAGPDLRRVRDRLPAAAQRDDDLVVVRRRQVGDDVVPVEQPHRLLLERPARVVADDHDGRDPMPDERVDVHEREAGRPVAHQQEQRRLRVDEARGQREARSRAEAAVRSRVQPAAGLLRLDVPAGERDEVAAVADDDRVRRQPRQQLAVDPRGMDRGCCRSPGRRRRPPPPRRPQPRSDSTQAPSAAGPSASASRLVVRSPDERARHRWPRPTARSRRPPRG